MFPLPLSHLKTLKSDQFEFNFTNLSNQTISNSNINSFHQNQNNGIQRKSKKKLTNSSIQSNQSKYTINPQTIKTPAATKNEETIFIENENFELENELSNGLSGNGIKVKLSDGRGEIKENQTNEGIIHSKSNHNQYNSNIKANHLSINSIQNPSIPLKTIHSLSAPEISSTSNYSNSASLNHYLNYSTTSSSANKCSTLKSNEFIFSSISQSEIPHHNQLHFPFISSFNNNNNNTNNNNNNNNSRSQKKIKSLKNTYTVSKKKLFNHNESKQNHNQLNSSSTAVDIINPFESQPPAIINSFSSNSNSNGMIISTPPVFPYFSSREYHTKSIQLHHSSGDGNSESNQNLIYYLHSNNNIITKKINNNNTSTTHISPSFINEFRSSNKSSNSSSSSLSSLPAVVDHSIDQFDPAGVSLSLLLSDWKSQFLFEKSKFQSKITFIQSKWAEIQSILGHLDRPNPFLIWISIEFLYEWISGWNGEKSREFGKLLIVQLMNGIYMNYNEISNEINHNINNNNNNSNNNSFSELDQSILLYNNDSNSYFLYVRQLLQLLKSLRINRRDGEIKLIQLKSQWNSQILRWQPQIMKSIQRYQRIGKSILFYYWKLNSIKFHLRYEESILRPNTFPNHIILLRKQFDSRHFMAVKFLKWREWTVRIKYISIQRELNELYNNNINLNEKLLKSIELRQLRLNEISNKLIHIENIKLYKIIYKQNIEEYHKLLIQYEFESNNCMELLDYFSSLYIRSMEQQEFISAQFYYNRYQNSDLIHSSFNYNNYHNTNHNNNSHTNSNSLADLILSMRNNLLDSQSIARDRRYSYTKSQLTNRNNNNRLNTTNNNNNSGGSVSAMNSRKNSIVEESVRKKFMANLLVKKSKGKKEKSLGTSLMNNNNSNNNNNAIHDRYIKSLPSFLKSWIDYQCWQFNELFHSTASASSSNIMNQLDYHGARRPDSFVPAILHAFRSLSLTRFSSPIPRPRPTEIPSTGASPIENSSSLSPSSSHSSEFHSSSTSTNLHNFSYLRCHLFPRDAAERHRIESQFRRRRGSVVEQMKFTATESESASLAITPFSSNFNPVERSLMRNVIDSNSGMQMNIRYLLTQSPSTDSANELKSLFSKLSDFQFKTSESWNPNDLIHSISLLGPSKFESVQLVRAHQFVQRSIELMPVLASNSSFPSSSSSAASSSLDPDIFSAGILWLLFTYPSIPYSVDSLLLPLAELFSLTKSFSYHSNQFHHSDQLKILVNTLKSLRINNNSHRTDGFHHQLQFEAELRQSELEITQKLMKRIKKMNLDSNYHNSSEKSDNSNQSNTGSQLAAFSMPSAANSAFSSALNSPTESPRQVGLAVPTTISVDPIVFSPKPANSSTSAAATSLSHSRQPVAGMSLASMMALNTGLSHSFNKRAEAAIAHSAIVEERKIQRAKKKESELELSRSENNSASNSPILAVSRRLAVSNKFAAKPAISIDVNEADPVSAIASPILMNNSIRQLDADDQENGGELIMAINIDDQSDQHEVAEESDSAPQPHFSISLDSSNVTVAAPNLIRTKSVTKNEQLVLIDSHITPVLQADRLRLSSVFSELTSTPNHMRLRQTMAAAASDESAPRLGLRRQTSIPNLTPSAGNQGRFPIPVSGEAERRACQTMMGKYLNDLRKLFRSYILPDKNEKNSKSQEENDKSPVNANERNFNSNSTPQLLSPMGHNRMPLFDPTALIEPLSVDESEFSTDSKMSRIQFAGLCRRYKLLTKTLTAAAVDKLIETKIKQNQLESATAVANGNNSIGSENSLSTTNDSSSNENHLLSNHGNESNNTNNENSSSAANEYLSFDDFLELLIKMASMKYSALPEIPSRLALFFGRDLNNSNNNSNNNNTATTSINNIQLNSDDFRSIIALSCDYIFEKHNIYLSSLFNSYALTSQSDNGYYESSMNRENFNEFIHHTLFIQNKIIGVRTIQHIWNKAQVDNEEEKNTSNTNNTANNNTNTSGGPNSGIGGFGSGSMSNGYGGLESMVYFEFLESVAALSCHFIRNPFLSVDVKLDELINYFQTSCPQLQSKRKSHLILKSKIENQKEKNRILNEEKILLYNNNSMNKELLIEKGLNDSNISSNNE